jgi:hypothetical protein
MKTPFDHDRYLVTLSNRYINSRLLKSQPFEPESLEQCSP